MNKSTHYFSLLYLVLCSFFVINLNGMVCDNRWFPLVPKPYIEHPGCHHLRIHPFFMVAEDAQGDVEPIPLANLDGYYDQITLIDAMVTAGTFTENPLRTDLQGIPSLPWRRDGKLEAQGIAFYYILPLSPRVSAGFSTLFMSIQSRQEFCLDRQTLDGGRGDRNYLFALKEYLHQHLNVVPALYSNIVLGDFDFFLQLHQRWEYLLRCRSIDLDVRFGAIAPTASPIPINNPAAIPSGGGDFWGAYAAAMPKFEVKEDIHIGCLARVQKRFRNTLTQRLPILSEPSRYGAISGPVTVDPGFTFVFYPYIMLEAIREGFGVSAQYFLVKHFQDTITDLREDQTIPVNLDPVMRRSEWASEYVTIGAFYNFSKFCPERSLPTLSVYWALPVDWLVSERSARTTMISLMIEWDY